MDEPVIAESRTEYKPRDYRIISIRTARRILHVEDVLELGQIRFELWAYERGSGASAHVEAYVDADTSRLLAHLLAEGSLPEPIEEMGGGMVQGELTARVLRVEEATETQNPIRLTIINGPGTRQESGLISLVKGAQVEKVQILLNRMDARRVGLALRDHLLAWAVRTYDERVTARRRRVETEDTAEAVEAPALTRGRSGPDSIPRPLPEHRAATEPAPAGDEEPLRYLNGTTVGDNEREVQAFRAYLQAEGTPPTSRDALRRWVMNTPKRP